MSRIEPAKSAGVQSTTTMWEAKAADGRAEELLEWVLTHAPAQAQLYRSADRVVVIDPGGTAGQDLADVPAALMARPAMSWPFHAISR